MVLVIRPKALPAWRWGSTVDVCSFSSSLAPVVHGYDFVEVLEPGSFVLHVDWHQPADGPTLATTFTNTRRGPPSRAMKYPTRAW